MYHVDASDDWFLKQAEAETKSEDISLRRAAAFETFTKSDVYREAKDHIFKTFIYGTPKFKMDELIEKRALVTYVKQEGIRFLFDYIESVVQEGKRIQQEREGNR